MESIREMIASLSQGNAEDFEEMKKSLSVAGKSYNPKEWQEALDSLHYPRKRNLDKD